MSGTSVVGTLGKKAAITLTVLLAGSVSYAVVGVWHSVGEAENLTRVANTQATSADESVNPFASANGTNLVAFIITASDCGWSERPEAMQAVGDLRKKLLIAYSGKYAQIRVVGVALDEDVSKGFEFLAKIAKGDIPATFDQISVGQSWLNEDIVRLVWREGIASAASPQVLVLERRIKSDEYLSTSKIEVQSDRVLVVAVGTQQITRWIDSKLPLNDTVFGASPARKSVADNQNR